MKVEIVNSNTYLDKTEDFNAQYQILIKAYAQTEREIWGENYIRISLPEYVDLVKNEVVFSALLNNEIVGTIMLSNEGNETYSFGLLAVDFSKKGFGIGRLLIEKAEEVALEQGGKTMSIEILKPKNEPVPFKVQLAQWYERQGYVFTFSKSFIELKPTKIEKAKGLITDAVFDCYEKKLNSVSL